MIDLVTFETATLLQVAIRPTMVQCVVERTTGKATFATIVLSSGREVHVNLTVAETMAKLQGKKPLSDDLLKLNVPKIMLKGEVS